MYLKDRGEQGWVCPRCGTVNAPWNPTCACAKTAQPVEVRCPYCGKINCTTSHVIC